MGKNTFTTGSLVGHDSVNIELTESYRHCRDVVTRAASSFAYPMILLPKEKRQSMYALYAFLRRSDDLSDSDAPLDQRRQNLAQWRQSLESALTGKYRDPILPALNDTLQRYTIPPQHLRDVLEGVEMDLNPQPFETFDELNHYCHRVASSVGLACIHIWGFDKDVALEPALHCGTAFQLTNILRDVKEDADRGRVYLPMEDLRRFGYDQADLNRELRNESFCNLMEFEIRRAELYYELARPLANHLHEDGQRIFRAMFEIYRKLLNKIKRRKKDVLTHRVDLGGWTKMWIVATSKLTNQG